MSSSLPANTPGTMVPQVLMQCPGSPQNHLTPHCISLALVLRLWQLTASKLVRGSTRRLQVHQEAHCQALTPGYLQQQPRSPWRGLQRLCPLRCFALRQCDHLGVVALQGKSAPRLRARPSRTDAPPPELNRAFLVSETKPFCHTSTSQSRLASGSGAKWSEDRGSEWCPFSVIPLDSPAYVVATHFRRCSCAFLVRHVGNSAYHEMIVETHAAEANPGINSCKQLKQDKAQARMMARQSVTLWTCARFSL